MQAVAQDNFHNATVVQPKGLPPICGAAPLNASPSYLSLRLM